MRHHTTALLAGVLALIVAAPLAVVSAPARRPIFGTFELVFASGLDRGPQYIPNIKENAASQTGLMQWQTATKRTGEGAYHFVGGDLTGEHELISDSTREPFGGLETWIGGAFRFAGFPNRGLSPMWLMAAAPTDGVAGADDKPVAAITPEGRVQLVGSNIAPGVLTTTTLTLHKWYYLLVHGQNGVARRQELLLYDGDTGELLETLGLTMTVSGTFREKIAKWGHLTRQDCSGLDYYLDDLIFVRGNVGPGAVKVLPKKPIRTAFNNGFWTVGAAAAQVAVTDVPPDGDATYIRNDTIISVSHQIDLDLAPATAPRIGTVHAVQTLVVGRALSDGATPVVGIGVNGIESLQPVSLVSGYAVRHVIQTTNPLTTLRWAPGDIDTFRGVIKDADTLTTEFRVTNAWWEIIYSLAPGINPQPTPTPTGKSR